MKKKSQMELMGIAIVVLIVSMIMVFVINYAAHRKPESHKQEYTESELVTNVVKTLLYTTAPDCYGLTFSELIQNCIENYNFHDQRITCEDIYLRDSCYYVVDHTADILNSTLEKWQVDYEFRVVWGNMGRYGTTSYPNITIPITGGCPPGSTSQRMRPYTLTTGVGATNIMLIVCS